MTEKKKWIEDTFHLYHQTKFTFSNYKYSMKKMTAADDDDDNNNNDDWIQYTNNSVISGLIEIYCKDFNPSICLEGKTDDHFT